MERERTSDNETGFDSLGDATAMERRNSQPAMESGKTEETDEPTGDEMTAVEGAAANAAAQRNFGGGPARPPGGIGTDVPTDEEEPRDGVDESKDSSDPRGY